MSVIRRPITSGDRRRAVGRAVARQTRCIRITEGMRRAIVGDAAYRAGRKVER